MSRLFSLLFLAFLQIGCSSKSTDETSAYQIVIVRGKLNGYAYQIKAKGKLLINQEFIPATKGFQEFINEKEAKKVADLVVTKLTDTQELPTVTLKELDSLHIQYDK